MTDEDLRGALDELAKSIQVVSILATRLRQTIGNTVEDTITLEAQADRAVRALKGLPAKDRE